MTNGNDSTTPQINEKGIGDYGSAYYTYHNTGLTKREYFAAMAMQGLAAYTGNVASISRAVELADELINELNK